MDQEVSNEVRRSGFLDQEAFQAYTAKAEGRWPFRNYLPQCILQEMAEVLERPITLEELSLIVGEDGEKRTCSGTGEEFQPVWWKGVGHPSRENQIRRFSLREIFREELSRWRSVAEALERSRILTFGCFYITKEKKCLAFSGPAVWFDVVTGNYNLPMKSPLADAKKAHPDGYWGKSFGEIELTLAKNREYQERRERTRELMASVRPQKRGGQQVGRGCIKPLKSS
ncbi:MAG: hypothetical protein G01um1014107_81 [Parcubacteria group bacterium Gr01-1014_107]|nr:MAG: hypothetical protein G01um1014107_81 [Parcubacteria group bacterium Gr01-1014_107]